MIPEIAVKQMEIARLCRRFEVVRLDIFGSAATGAFEPETSDLDFVARFARTNDTTYPDRYLDFAEELERLFNRDVDVITERSVRNPYFRAEIDRTRELVYAADNEEAAG